MLSPNAKASLDKKAFQQSKHLKGALHEATGFYQGHRTWRCRRSRGGRAGDRAIDAGDQMAHADELAEVARYAVWRRRDDGKDGWRGDRQQVSDPAVRGRRDR